MLCRRAWSPARSVPDPASSSDFPARCCRSKRAITISCLPPNWAASWSRPIFCPKRCCTTANWPSRIPANHSLTPVAPIASAPRYTSLMTRFLSLFVLLAGFAFAQNRVYELRTYTCNEGKLEALKARFRDHTIEIFKRHGIESVGYWIPQDPEKSKTPLIYIMAKSPESVYMDPTGFSKLK